MVPRVAKRVRTRSKTVASRFWKSAVIELKTAMMALKMEETKSLRDSTREGMFALFCLKPGRLWFCMVERPISKSDA